MRTASYFDISDFHYVDIDVYIHYKYLLDIVLGLEDTVA